MKKINLSLIAIVTFGLNVVYGQGGGAAYQQLRGPDNSVQDAIQRNNEIYQRNAEIAQMNRILAEERRQGNLEAYQHAKSIALEEYNSKDFSRCIYYYESSNNLGWFDGEFEYMAGVSYFELWKETKDEKYKSKAKRLLRLSKNHGYIEAELFLKNNF
jgi:hypothetical protein